MTDMESTGRQASTEQEIRSPLEAEGATQRYVRLGDLVLEHELWKNPRTESGLDDTTIGELAATIKAATRETPEGVLAGINVALEVVMVLGGGDIINLVIDGQRRVVAANAARLGPDALVRVVDLEPEPVTLTAQLAATYLMRALAGVATRSGLSSPELLDSAMRLRQAHYTLAEIHRAIGRSETWISKMLKAASVATATLMTSWRAGEITDEVFKELAEQVDPAKQRQAAAAVIAARRAGDKGESRLLAKEIKESARAEIKPAPVATKPEAKPLASPSKVGKAAKSEPHKPAVSGPQVPLPLKKPTKAVMMDFLALPEKKPPTHDYVKGLMDGVGWANGTFDAANFARPWGEYLRRVSGEPKAAKKGKKKAKR